MSDASEGAGHERTCSASTRVILFQATYGSEDRRDQTSTTLVVQGSPQLIFIGIGHFSPIAPDLNARRTYRRKRFVANQPNIAYVGDLIIARTSVSKKFSNVASGAQLR
ncbi:hypothetical protein TNCV_2499671 [Trichonephila clavipes]|nr:hypothetical protein TNCV_2499671 [Trichonephila clavipes]